MKSGKIKNAYRLPRRQGQPDRDVLVPDLPELRRQVLRQQVEGHVQQPAGQGRGRVLRRQAEVAGPAGVAEYDSDQEGAAILGGKAGAIIQYTGNAIKSDDPKLSKEVGKLDFAVVPKQVKALAQIGIFIHGVSASAPNKDNAITFMKWFGTDKAQLALAMAGDVPVRIKPLKDPTAVKAHRLLPTVLAQINSGAEARPRTPDWGAVESILGTELNKALVAGKGGGAALDRAATQADGVPEASGLLQLMAAQRTARARQQGAGIDRFLPYLLLAPAVLLVLAVVVYPLISGVQTSTRFYRFGAAISNVGFDQYRQASNDPLFTGARLDDAQVRHGSRRDRDAARPRAGAPVPARVAVHPRDAPRADRADGRHAGRGRHRLPPDLRIGRRALLVGLGALRRRLGRHPRQREPGLLGPRRCSTCGSGRR